jgi:hypothetical protein
MNTMPALPEQLRQVANEVRRTPIRLDTWIPMIQKAADALDEALEAEVRKG